MYEYAKEKPKLFCEENMVKIMKMYRAIAAATKSSGCVTMGKIFPSGDTWTSMAMADFLKEHKMIQEITGDNQPGQDRVFRTP